MNIHLKFTHHLKALECGIYIALFILVAVYFIGRKEGVDADLIVFFLIFFLINLLPAFYLHTQYYFCNRNEKYQLTDGLITQLKNGKKHFYKRDEIQNIIIYMPPSVYKGSNLHFLAIEGYSYARIMIKNNESLVLTCLLAPQLER